MLTDTERKVLRILAKMYGHEWVRPNIAKISRLSLRTPDQVRAAVKGLVKHGYAEIAAGKMRVLYASEMQLLELKKKWWKV